MKTTGLILFLTLITTTWVCAQSDPLVRAFVDLAEATDTLLESIDHADDAESVIAGFEVFNQRLIDVLPRLAAAEQISPYARVSSPDELPEEIREVVVAAGVSINRLSIELFQKLDPYKDNDAVILAWNRMGELFRVDGDESKLTDIGSDFDSDPDSIDW